MRGAQKKYRKAAIHISFEYSHYLEALWDELDGCGPADRSLNPAYRNWKALLERQARSGQLPVHEFRRVLHDSTEVLAEVLVEFDDEVFDKKIRAAVEQGSAG